MLNLFTAHRAPNKTQTHKSDSLQSERSGAEAEPILQLQRRRKSGKPTNRRWGDQNSDWKEPELEVAAAPKHRHQHQHQHRHRRRQELRWNDRMIVPTDSRTSGVRARGWGGDRGRRCREPARRKKSEKNQQQQLQQLLERERAFEKRLLGESGAEELSFCSSGDGDLTHQCGYAEIGGTIRVCYKAQCLQSIDLLERRSPSCHKGKGS